MFCGVVCGVLWWFVVFSATHGIHKKLSKFFAYFSIKAIAVVAY